MQHSYCNRPRACSISKVLTRYTPSTVHVCMCVCVCVCVHVRGCVYSTYYECQWLRRDTPRWQGSQYSVAWVRKRRLLGLIKEIPLICRSSKYKARPYLPFCLSETMFKKRLSSPACWKAPGLIPSLLRLPWARGFTPPEPPLKDVHRN